MEGKVKVYVRKCEGNSIREYQNLRIGTLTTMLTPNNIKYNHHPISSFSHLIHSLERHPTP